MNKIIFVTGNSAKVREVQEILNMNLEIASIELDEIQEIDLQKVALHKLNQAFEIVKKPVMVDDVSFSINAWNGFPGPLIKWILKAGDGPGLMIKMLEHEKNRNVVASLVIGFHDGEKPHLFFGEAKGTISREIKGDNGFGWDRVFIPDGYSQTYSEMDSKLKNSISHRAIALEKLSDFLKEKYDI